MPDQSTPLDAPEEIEATTKQDLFKSLLIQLLTISFFVMGHLLQLGNTLFVGLFGMGILLILEFLTSKPLPKGWFPPLRFAGFLLGIASVLVVCLYFLEAFVAFVRPYQIVLLSALVLYHFLWAVHPNPDPRLLHPPWFRLALGAALLFFYWLILSFALNIFFILNIHLYASIAVVLLFFALLLTPRLIAPEQQAVFVDDSTWLRFPQLFYLLIVLGFFYWHNGPLGILF
ncbi:MAG: hypothetical protein ACRBFS_06435 [Aureispira sp.]